MKAIFIAIQDSDSRQWLPVAKVTKGSNTYRLVYTKGAWSAPGFNGFGRMNDLQGEYHSNEIFPILKNRTLPKSRPEYADYISWLNLTPDSHDELEVLARSGGIRATDQIELVPTPTANEDGTFETFFFVRGISHHPAMQLNEISNGDRLYVMRDFQNKKDPAALLLRTDDPISLVGYAPRYLCNDLNQLSDSCLDENLVVTVEKVNKSAPDALRILCKASSLLPDGFSFFNSPEFEELHEAE